MEIGAATGEAADDVSVVVAVLTYRRPELLAACLAACAEMERPAGARVTLLVVDNDAGGSAAEVAGGAPGEVRYVREARKGIPVARNRALDEALAIGARLLCFIDDDECPDRDWLVRLVACWRDSGADLVGGPVDVAAPSPDASARQRLINASLKARMARKAAQNRRAAETGRRFTILTNNCLLDLDWQRRHGLRFDEALLFTGGSDTMFFRGFARLKGRSAWCPQAMVRETMPPKRLTLAYQMARGAEQSKAHLEIKRMMGADTGVAVTMPVAAARLVLGAILLVVPVFGMASPVMAVRSIGWAIGRFQALRGSRSRLYE